MYPHLEMHGSGKGFALRFLFEFEHGEKLLLGLFGQTGSGSGLIQRYRLAQAVEVRCAIGASFEVSFQLTTLGRCELGIEFLADMAENILAVNWFLLHVVM